jgi:phage recombination protein Bet
MNNIIALNTKDSLWYDQNQLKEIRQMASSSPLTEMEFKALVGIGRATGLNPFRKELWAVKYNASQPAQIFIGLNGYRIGARRHPDYEYHQVDAVYSDDKFERVGGEIVHRAGFSNRGKLVGAYCVVKLKSSSKPTYVTVTMDEYNQNQSLWKTKPETMIKKVAECQGLRQAFPEIFSGTYSDAEMPPVPMQPKPLEVIQGETQTEKLKSILKQQSEENESIAIETIEVDDSLSPIERIEVLLKEKEFTEERIEKALAYYGVDSLEELDEAKALSFLAQLEKV